MAKIPDAFKLTGIGGQTAGQGPAGLSQQELDEVRKQAAALWQALDEMAENDPDAYAAFIKRQQEENAKTAPPVKGLDPVMSLTIENIGKVFVWPAKDGVLTKPTSFSGAAVDCLQFSMLETGTQQSQAVHVAVHPAWLTAAATQQQAMATLVTALKQWACNLKGIKGDPTTILKVNLPSLQASSQVSTPEVLAPKANAKAKPKIEVVSSTSAETAAKGQV